MSRAKLRVDGIHQADTKAQQFVVSLSRPLSTLEVLGLTKAIEQAVNTVNTKA